MGATDAYWVTPNQIKQEWSVRGIGRHGAFAVTGKRNWLRNIPLKLAIGLITDDSAKFVGGPITAVAAKTNIYVVIVPGDVTGKNNSYKIPSNTHVKRNKEQREKIGKLSIEQEQNSCHLPKPDGAPNLSGKF